MRGYELSDFEWGVIAPLLPKAARGSAGSTTSVAPLFINQRLKRLPPPQAATTGRKDSI
jgi:hypothetical protein